MGIEESNRQREREGGKEEGRDETESRTRLDYVNEKRCSYPQQIMENPYTNDPRSMSVGKCH